MIKKIILAIFIIVFLVLVVPIPYLYREGMCLCKPGPVCNCPKNGDIQWRIPLIIQFINSGQGVMRTGEKKINMSEVEARKIAEAICIKGGEALGGGIYNEGTKTWWFDANLNSVREGCNPACVVSEETKTAEINWRCTGLIEPK